MAGNVARSSPSMDTFLKVKKCVKLSWNVVGAYRSYEQISIISTCMSSILGRQDHVPSHKLPDSDSLNKKSTAEDE